MQKNNEGKRPSESDLDNHPPSNSDEIQHFVDVDCVSEETVLMKEFLRLTTGDESNCSEEIQNTTDNVIQESESNNGQSAGLHDPCTQQAKSPADVAENGNINFENIYVKTLISRLSDANSNLNYHLVENVEAGVDDENVCFFNLLSKEIVLKIFSYFSPVELSKCIGPVCKYWYGLAYDPCLWWTLNFDFNSDISSVYLCFIIMRVGCIRKLVIQKRTLIDVAEVSIFTKYCSRLRDLDLAFCDRLDASMLEYVVENCKDLNRLNVEGCILVNDDCAQVLSKAKNLKHMNLKYCSLTDDGVQVLVKSLPRIVTLNIDGIARMSDRSIILLCTTHQQSLEELVLDGEDLSDDSLKAVSECTHLTKLLISFCDGLTDISLPYVQALKNLRNLTLRRGEAFSSPAIYQLFSTGVLDSLVILELTRWHNLHDETVWDITKCCGRTLKRLSLCWCAEIKEEGITSIVDNCGKLEFLDLTGLHFIYGHCFNRVPEEMPNLKFMDFTYCDNIEEDMIMDVVTRKKDLTVVDYYGEEIVYGATSLYSACNTIMICDDEDVVVLGGP